MSSNTTNSSAPTSIVFRLLKRVVSFLIVATIVGSIFHFSSPWIYRKTEPAGFVRGMAHGALMPMAMPNLAVGKDVTIYADYNTGLSYKLGYTVGVNICGILFFGFFFWRVNRWRNRTKAAQG
jgi:hypothetical protein